MRGHWWVYYALKAVEKELGWMPTQAQVLGWTMVAMLGVFPKTMRHVCRNERGALFGWGMFPLLVALHGQDMSNVFFRSLEGNDLISHFLVHEDGKYSVVQHEVGTAENTSSTSKPTHTVRTAAARTRHRARALSHS